MPTTAPRPRSAVSLSVVIATSGNPTQLDRTLYGLTCQKMQEFEVHVCDDGTDDNTARVCGEYSRWLDILCARTNAGRGAGYARNRGIETALAPRVLIIDDDCVPDRDVTEWHASFGDRAVGLVGLRRMVQPEHHTKLIGDIDAVPWTPEPRAGGNQYNRMTRLARQRAVALYKYAYTCHVSYPTHALRAVGGFWEAFRGSGFEDLELALRLCRWGLQLLPFDRPAVYHQNHPQSKHQSENFTYNQALYRQTVADTKLVHRPGALRTVEAA